MWLVSAFDYFNSNSNIVSNGFMKAGITDAIEGQQRELLSDEDPFNDLEDQTVCKQDFDQFAKHNNKVFYIHVLNRNVNIA